MSMHYAGVAPGVKVNEVHEFIPLIAAVQVLSVFNPAQSFEITAFHVLPEVAVEVSILL